MATSQAANLAEQSAERPGPHLRVHAVNVFVRDQEQSRRFYLEQLDFTLAYDIRLQSGQRWLGVAPPDGTAVLSLIAPEVGSEQYQLIGRPTGIVFVTEDIASKYAAWRKRGVRFRHTPRLRRMKYEHVEHGETPSLLLGKQTPVWGSVFTRFEDLDGNVFTLISIDEMTQAVEAQRRQATAKQESERRAAHEMEIARQVQSRLFPQSLPPMKTLDYAGACIQASQVGGDYYDFLHLGKGRLGLVLGDIAGKGIAGALLMANLQANLRSQCAVAVDEPQRLLRSVNQLFYDNTADNAYTTLFFAEYDERTQNLRYINCGHLPALLFRSDSTLVRLDSTCTVLGLFNEWDCSIRECSFNPGDTLAIYTDGITEAFSASEEEFGEERLIEVLQQQRELPAKELLAAVVDAVGRYSPGEQHDDITLIIARCGSAG
ncbi:MAG TPA: SpoIIE family protein phosphatase [Candidatus Sulfotelmatobacter sp.]|nr:SpoIIE family protein phosphatase [Candidatus Sulfotelmatobacter sp.]